MPLMDCYRCCAAFRPRYKRLVDNIYPVNPQDGLIRANLDKLIFYACSSPEKLDRIGEYLAQRVNRDIYRRRYAFINLSMEAMDQLLVSCHTRALNLYLESFLKTIENLLESEAPELKILASQSFYRFANIEEDMPSYHRRYAFFVQSFSQLCHCAHNNTEVRNRLRVAGLKGIQGVVRKTCSEDLAESIWNAERMNLIIPSLLFNMQDSRPGGDRRTPDFDSGSEQNDPATIAESCLCEIVKRTPFSNVEIVLKPVLDHLDNHGLWIPNDFAMYAFERIMYTIPVHLAYKVIQLIMSHLEASRDKPAQIRIHINNVLTKAISIATGDGAGPSVLVIVDGLLKQLSSSFNSGNRNSIDSDDLAFKDGIIKTLADFSKECPDFQKTDILTFIVAKIPTDSEVQDRELQRVLLEAVARVAAYYKTVQLNSIFKNDLVVDKLSRVLLSIDVATRLLAHDIIHSLLDRHQNIERVRKISLLPGDHTVTFASPARYDVQFFRKYGKDLLETCEDSLNLPEVNIKCVESVYMTFALMVAEISCQETAADFVHSIINLQDLACGNKSLDPNVRNTLHAGAICLLRLLALGLKLEELLNYTRQVETSRIHHHPEILPPRSLSSASASENIPSDCLLEREKIAEVFKSLGWDSAYSQLCESSSQARYSYAESTSGPNTVDSTGVVVELDTPSNSPLIIKRSPSADISFATFKRILAEPAEKRREAKREKWNEMAAFYRTATFAEMMERQDSARYQRTPGIPLYQFRQKHHLEPFETNLAPEEVGNYAIKFPDLFMN